MQLATAHINEHVTPGGRVVEFGNQRFRYNPSWTAECGKIAGREIRSPVNNVWEYFEDLGFSDYLAIDVNTNMRAVAMNLNVILRDEYDYNEEFDLVTNNGTSEHILNQGTVFENMHNLCKVGGIMICVLPFSPWINHGFFRYNPSLFRDIVLANGYEWVLLWLGRNSGEYFRMPTVDKSWAWYERKSVAYEAGALLDKYEYLSNMGTVNTSIVAAYRKVNDAPFQIPIEGRYVGDVTDGFKI